MARRRRRRTYPRRPTSVDYGQPVETQVDFADEYRYVLSDLKRFAVLAAAMFAVLIVLALVLA